MLDFRPLYLQQDFKPRARVGRDEQAVRPVDRRRHFNPRARVGRDNTFMTFLLLAPYFNPRARVGRDLMLLQDLFLLLISIHAPAWGATSTCAQFFT